MIKIMAKKEIQEESTYLPCVVERVKFILPAVARCLNHIENQTNMKVYLIFPVDHKVTNSDEAKWHKNSIRCDVQAIKQNKKFSPGNFSLVPILDTDHQLCWMDIVDKIDNDSTINARYKIMLANHGPDNIKDVTKSIAFQVAWLSTMIYKTFVIIGWHKDD